MKNKYCLWCLAVIYVLVFPLGISAGPPIAGKWNADYGMITFEESGNGKYESDQGRLFGSLNGHTYSGFWVEHSSAVRCLSRKDGSEHWGPVEFVFNEDFSSFTGKWGYCGRELSSNWNGRRIAVVAEPPATSPPAHSPSIANSTSPTDCLDLRRHLNKKLVELANQKKEYDKWQETFNQFYNDSKIDMCVVYEDPFWTFRNPIPFMGDMSIDKPVALTGGVDHMPKLRLTSPVSRRSKVLGLVGELEKLIGIVGNFTSVGRASDVTTGFKEIFTQLTDKLTDYDQGIETHKKFTASRKNMLGNYSRILSIFYCDKILPLEEEILLIRDRDMEKSDCNIMDKQVLTTDITRGSDMRNDVHLNRAKEYCNSL